MVFGNTDKGVERNQITGRNKPMKSIEVKDKIKQIFFWVCVCVVYFIMQLSFLNDAWFGTDELDIMVIGRDIVRGLRLYKDAFSQHMPFSYYLSAFFNLLGANTVIQQRIAFYIFFAIMWTVIAYIYSEHMNKYVLFIYPIIHCSLIQTYDLGTQILSEHLAGIGAVILILEYLEFINTRQLKTRSCVMISLAVVLTFGTIFVAIFSVFFIALGVLLIEIKWEMVEKKPIKEWLQTMLKRYIKLFLIVAIPWILLLIHLIITHTVSEFIYGAYTLNRYIYPKYNGGFGGSILTTLVQPVQVLFENIFNILNTQGFSYALCVQIIFLLCVFFFLYKIYEEKGILVALTVYVFAGSLAVRGVFNFHATQFMEVGALIIAYVLCIFGYKSKEKFSHIGSLKQIILISVTAILVSGYFKGITKLTMVDFTEPTNATSEVIKEITEDDESIWSFVFCNDIIMMSDRTAVGATVTTPWTWEGYGETQFADLMENPPRVAYYYDDFEVWGNKQVDYAPDAIEYLKANYTQLEGAEGVYVRNDYYEEACRIIE